VTVDGPRAATTQQHPIFSNRRVSGRSSYAPDPLPADTPR
jgi:hypothetical protein